jgi:hypothetical protein
MDEAPQTVISTSGFAWPEGIDLWIVALISWEHYLFLGSFLNRAFGSIVSSALGLLLVLLTLRLESTLVDCIASYLISMYWDLLSLPGVSC